MPTGVHLANARELLFEAAESVLVREGVSGLTSRAVTTEAGVAKGVMHRHFVDFDAFLAELVLDRAQKLQGPLGKLRQGAGKGTIAGNLVQVLASTFSPLAVAVPALVITRDGLRARLRAAGAARFPLIGEACQAIAEYLAEEKSRGRLPGPTDVATLAPTLIGAAHLLFADKESGRPDAAALRRLVTSLL